MQLSEWARRWGVSDTAMGELRAMIIADTPTDPTTNAPPLSEAAVQNLVRLEASRAGARVWRNNVGAYQDEYGNFIRYGLANDSQAMNRVCKSSDLIGIKPVTIQQSHVGLVLGQFIAREVKEGGWSYKGTAREKGQLKFMELVTALGGDACFATGEGTIL